MIDIYIEPIRDRAVSLLRTGWTQGNSAKDDDGVPKSVDSPNACQWCLTGAIRLAVQELVPQQEGHEAYDCFLKLWAYKNKAHTGTIMDWWEITDADSTAINFNDKDVMTQEEVVASLLRV